MWGLYTLTNVIIIQYASKNCAVNCRKAEIDVLYDNKPSSSTDGDFNSKAAAEAQVLVRAEEVWFICSPNSLQFGDMIFFGPLATFLIDPQLWLIHSTFNVILICWQNKVIQLDFSFPQSVNWESCVTTGSTSISPYRRVSWRLHILQQNSKCYNG